MQISISRDDSALELHVARSAPGYLLVLQAFHPGWTADLDGRSAPVLAANVLFQAMEVPAGSHTVVVAYRPTDVTVGEVASAAGIAMIALIAVFGRPGIRRAIRGTRDRATRASSST